MDCDEVNEFVMKEFGKAETEVYNRVLGHLYQYVINGEVERGNTAYKKKNMEVLLDQMQHISKLK